MSGDITSANAILTLSVPVLFPVGQQIQGFSTDDIYGVAQIKSVETAMGVDGVLSGGFVFVAIVQTLMLQADSESNDFFDQVYAAQQAAQTVFFGNGSVILPAIGKKFLMINGLLTTFKLPGAAKTLRPRTFRFQWNKVLAAPL